MKSLFTRLFLFLVAVLFGVSCQKEGSSVDPSADPHFVGRDEISCLASGLRFADTGSPDTKGVEKSVKDITPITDQTGNVSCYAVNYEGGGFLILAADDRVNPVLAFSFDHEFLTEVYPGGVEEWVDAAHRMVAAVRSENAPQTKAGANGWSTEFVQRVLNVRSYGGDDTDTGDHDLCPDCDNGSGKLYMDPLLSTTWNQGDGYNDLMPNGGCLSKPGYTNGRYPAGCVPVAMAQVMKYHRYPASYSWSAMPDDAGSTETCQLLKNIFDCVVTVIDCEGTGAPVGSIAPALMSNFGFRSAEQAVYDAWNVQVNVWDWKIPVLLYGADMTRRKAHVWVCDGYMRTHDCEIFGGNGSMEDYFHMNVGWGGSSNGWYLDEVWEFGSKTYPDTHLMIYNIRPK